MKKKLLYLPIFYAPNGVPPIACRQAHGAVVLCIAQSNRFREFR